jgi:hypothetical protein
MGFMVNYVIELLSGPAVRQWQSIEPVGMRDALEKIGDEWDKEIHQGGLRHPKIPQILKKYFYSLIPVL